MTKLVITDTAFLSQWPQGHVSLCRQKYLASKSIKVTVILGMKKIKLLK